MMNWKELQKGIQDKYPAFKSIPLWDRLKLLMFEDPFTCVDTFEEGFDKYSQTYRTYFYKGKTYFYKWGSR